MKLTILTTDEGIDIPVMQFATDAADTAELVRIQERFGLETFTLVSGDGDSLQKGYHFVNRIAFVLIDTKPFPLYQNAEFINLADDSEALDDSFDYVGGEAIDPALMTPEEIASRTIK